MGKEERGLRDGTGPYNRGVGRRRIAGDICPFDEDNKEDIENMDIKLNVKRDVKIVSDEIGKRRFIK